MAIDLQRARRFEELLAQPDDDGPYVHSSIFRADTWRQRRLSRKKFKLLKRIDEDLRPMLAEGERVLFLTQGSMVGFWETYFVGFVMIYLNRRAIAVTNRRILLLQITSRGYPRELRGEIDYRSVEDVEATVLRNTRIRFRNGTSRVLAYVPAADRKFLRDRIERLRDALADQKLTREDIRHLCPHCYAAAPMEDPACETCGGRFKSPKHAALLSLVFPGAGDFYLGHRWFAAAEVLGAGVLWAGLLAFAWDPAGSPLAFALLAAFLVVVVHGIDAVGTRYIARKGLYPAEGDGGAVRRYVLAALVPVLVVGASVVPLAEKRGLAPLAGIVSGDSVPPRFREALVGAGYLAVDESILRFHSAGVFSILEAGTILTDRRVLIYGHDGTAPFVAEAVHDSIIDLQRVVPPDADGMSVLIVARDDGEAFWFGLPMAQGQDLAFRDALRERWRAARDVRGEGVWFDGGEGATDDEAVVVRGLPPGLDPAGAERHWLTMWHGEENVDWRWNTRLRTTVGDRTVDRVVVEFAAQTNGAFYFDVTGRW